MEVHNLVKVLASISLMGLLGLLVKLYRRLVLQPRRIRAMMWSQGIRGPSPAFMLGNIWQIKRSKSVGGKYITAKSSSLKIHNCASTLFPFFEEWKKLYGEVFMFSLGNIQILYVNQPDMVKEITTCISMDLGKPSYQSKDRRAMLGNGILTSNGAIWAHQRKILAPELFMDKVKGMTDLIVESANIMINSWKGKIQKEGSILDLNIDEDIRNFSGNVISRACFGSNYSKEKEIFEVLGALLKVESNKAMSIGIPGLRNLPTKQNRKARALEKEVFRLILKGVKERKEAKHIEKDLMQMVVEGATNSDLTDTAIDEFIVDNCKNIYQAGYETSALTTLWCLMLLAANPEWQEKVRAEVLEVCASQKPDAGMLNKMKQLTMVIHETLRLYPPVPMITKEALKDMTFGGIHIPKGVNIWTSVVMLHTNPEIWGSDAYEFNPNRFANGITMACKIPYLYMPFGIGPRICLGQNLAMVELKIILALVLSNFSISLSPNYDHSPELQLLIKPGNGIVLLVKNL